MSCGALLNNQIRNNDVLSSVCASHTNTNSLSGHLMAWLPPDIKLPEVYSLLKRDIESKRESDNIPDFLLRMFCLWKLHINRSLENYISNLRTNIGNSLPLKSNAMARNIKSNKKFTDNCATLYYDITQENVLNVNQRPREKYKCRENGLHRTKDENLVKIFSEKMAKGCKENVQNDSITNDDAEIPNIFAVKRVLAELQGVSWTK